MQRASLAEPPDNLFIISRKIDDIYSRTQLGTAVRRKQLVNVIRDLPWIMADVVRFMIRVMIAAKQCRFVFHQRGDRKRRLAGSGDVVLPREPEKVRRENALRVVGGAFAVGKMDSVLCPPFLPLFEHVHHVAAVLMQSQEKPTKRSHAAQ